MLHANEIPRFFPDEVMELRDIAHDFSLRDKPLNYAFLMKLSDRLMRYRNIEAKAHDALAWFNRNYPEPSTNDDHPINALAMALLVEVATRP